jgi:hypothetical protein
MATFEIEIVQDDDPRFARCGVRSPGGAMRCEFPPGHRAGSIDLGPDHLGRDRLGRWRHWSNTSSDATPASAR